MEYAAKLLFLSINHLSKQIKIVSMNISESAYTQPKETQCSLPAWLANEKPCAHAKGHTCYVCCGENIMPRLVKPT